jgi:hypothetical protein|nr:MAG TPA: hypothetical protein [Caudoviricetes sp.]
MKKSVFDAIDRKLEEVDRLHDDNWVELGEKLQATILNSPEYTGAFTDEQKSVIIAVCRETYHAAAMTSRVYALEAIRAYHERNVR